MSVPHARYATPPVWSFVVISVQVAEETGYNLNGKIDPESVIEMEIKEQQISLFVVPGVSEDFPFETKTRKEISVSDLQLQRSIERTCHFQKIEWFRLADLPTWKRNKAAPGKFYLISPFIGCAESITLSVSS